MRKKSQGLPEIEFVSIDFANFETLTPRDARLVGMPVDGRKITAIDGGVKGGCGIGDERKLGCEGGTKLGIEELGF